MSLDVCVAQLAYSQNRKTCGIGLLFPPPLPRQNEDATLMPPLVRRLLAAFSARRVCVLAGAQVPVVAQASFIFAESRI